MTAGCGDGIIVTPAARSSSVTDDRGSRGVAITICAPALGVSIAPSGAQYRSGSQSLAAHAARSQAASAAPQSTANSGCLAKLGREDEGRLASWLRVRVVGLRLGPSNKDAAPEDEGVRVRVKDKHHQRKRRDEADENDGEPAQELAETQLSGGDRPLLQQADADGIEQSDAECDGGDEVQGRNAFVLVRRKLGRREHEEGGDQEAADELGAAAGEDEDHQRVER
eukprot:CAMPEP_0196724796 /NCGR_PEP_ID=MMETSP1091-20130531/6533_1 /TAXON_ID=302021 /ORGANISM="Rhodomonas sp., Strain CCMP768" /LENGTH=224 /DNA_ID=CAMNT_0042066973 /DNA_START=202 /DNA_END=875 /DNA_ORIENTATION=+